MLNLTGVSVSYGSLEAVRGITFAVEEGQWWALIGANGAGKSSLIAALTRETPCTGRIELLGKDIRRYSSREFARLVGVLSQKHTLTYGFTAEEVVALGRYAWRDGFAGPGDPEGEAAVRQAFAQTGLTELKRRSVLTLSGGETQRVFLAQVLAQRPRLLVLDEPANHLDLPYQRQLMDQVADWLAQGGRGVITVTHDLTLARKYASHALLLREGTCVAQGPIRQVMTPANLQALYGMDIFGFMQEALSLWQNP